MSVTGEGRKTRDASLSNQVVDLGPFKIRVAVVSSRDACVAGARPWSSDPGRKVLRVGAPVERAFGVSPEFPCRGGGAQTLKEPFLLLYAENCLRWRIFAKIRYCRSTETNFAGWMAASIAPTAVEYLKGLLGDKFRKLWTGQRLCLRSTRGILGT